MKDMDETKSKLRHGLDQAKKLQVKETREYKEAETKYSELD